MKLKTNLSHWRLSALTALLLAVAMISGGCTGNETQPQGHQAGHQAATGAKNAAPADSSAIGINKTPPPGQAPLGMVWIPGGTFRMGCDDCNMPDAEPIHPVTVDGFWMDQTPVTNRQFAEFVKATGYVTIAERKPDPKDFPGVPEDKLVAGSACFNPPGAAVPLDNPLAWWKYQC